MVCLQPGGESGPALVHKIAYNKIALAPLPRASHTISKRSGHSPSGTPTPQPRQSAETKRQLPAALTSKTLIPLQPDNLDPGWPSRNTWATKIREISADWRAMRTMILIVAGLLTLAMACSFTGTPTPRPTYTPYPTYTPAPLIPVGTTSALPTPTINPKTFHRAGKKHWFTGDTAEAVERGKETFAQGKYQEALEEFLEAQRLHGEPSAALQSRIGNSYSALGQSKAAIRHFTNAIELEDTAIYRTNRGNLYVETRQCSLAIEDAKTALAMEPATGEGSHTDIEANIILVGCYIQQGNHLSALQHADAAYALATKHNVRAERAEGMRKQREAIQLILEGNAWPEDLFSDQVLAILETSLELYERGEHQAAIAQFKATQKKHGTPSGAIQAWIGTAYSALEQHETALTHYTKAIEIREDPHHRVIRGIEYANHGRCAEAAVDAEEALAMNPYAEPGYHTSAEAYWILAACLQEKTQAHMGKALAIAQANGYTQEEIDISSETVEAWIILKNPGKTITAVPVVPIGQGAPTAPVVPKGQASRPEAAIEKDSLTRITDLQNAKWLQRYHPETAARVAQLPWVRDGLNTQEETILEDLLQILTTQSRSGVIMLSGTGKQDGGFSPGHAIHPVDQPRRCPGNPVPEEHRLQGYRQTQGDPRAPNLRRRNHR